MPNLVLGPILRYVSETEASVFAETDGACEVEVLGHRASTFEVSGHHYAIVCIDGLTPGSRTEYSLSLDGQQRWPEEGSEFPPSLIRTLDPEADAEVLFGSCRVGFPNDEPYVLSKDEHPEGREYDALYAKAHEMREGPVESWPTLMLLLGDQVYADDVSPQAGEFIEGRRDTSRPPGTEVADFEEYTRLYWESWGTPTMRWLLSTVSSSMIWDDHDVNDDWNISHSWVEDMRRTDWWDERIVSAYMSYFIYQHAGNLSPAELADHAAWRIATEAGGDAAAELAEWARSAEREEKGGRWSFCRDIGRTRVIALDSRGGRVLEPSRRSMFDDDEWDWVVERTRGDFDHLFFATSLPFLLGAGMHELEAWNEALCERGGDGPVGRLSERLRRALDLEHWAAFRSSWEKLGKLLEDCGAGKMGLAPASISVLSGDVHHAYLAEVAFRRSAGVQSAVYQAVCSPFRNPLNKGERRAIKFGISRAGAALGRALTAMARVPAPSLRWRFVEGPYFDNQAATLSLSGRSASLRLEKTRSGDAERDGPPGLDTVFEHRLA